MEVKDIIDLNIVKTNMNVSTKDEVIRELTTLLHTHNYVHDIEGFMKDIYAREAEGQTGIGNYVAIPHGKSEFVDKIGVAIGINESEIPWESLDGNGAKVVILFAVGNDSEGANSHLKLLSLFARKLGNDEVIEKLLLAKNADDVVIAFS